MTNRITAAGVQNFSITIASGSTTGSVALATAVGAGAFINYGGINPSVTTNFAEAGAYLSWATAAGTTTITATRNTGTTGTVVITGSMTDGDTTNLIKTVQQGTVSISASTSGTATVTAPSSDANSAIHFLGDTGTGTTLAWDTDFTRLTQSGTTVTATVPVSGTTVTGFCLIEFQSAALTANAVQRISASISTSVTSFTATITAVVLANTVTFYGGSTIATVTTNPATGAMRGALSATTTLTVNVNTASANAKTYNASAVEFVAGVLNSSVQRGTTTLTGVVTNNTALATINETYAGVSWLGNTATATTAVLNQAEGAAKLGTVSSLPYLQVAGATADMLTTSTLDVTLASTTSGSAIIVCVSMSQGNGATFPTSVSDSASQSYTNISAAQEINGTTNFTQIWYFQNTASGVTTVTTDYTSGSGIGTINVVVYEVPCPTVGSIIDATAIATSTPTGAITTSQSYDFIAIAYSVPTASVTAPYKADGIRNSSAWNYPSTTVSSQTATITGISCASTVAFKTNQTPPSVTDVVTVTKTTATANITGSWEVFEFVAFSGGGGTFNPGWTTGATKTIGGVF